MDIHKIWQKLQRWIEVLEDSSTDHRQDLYLKELVSLRGRIDQLEADRISSLR